jgi:hypothetical protein
LCVGSMVSSGCLEQKIEDDWDLLPISGLENKPICVYWRHSLGLFNRFRASMVEIHN